MMVKATPPYESEATQRFTFAVPGATLDSLRRISELEERSIGWVVREAVDRFIKEYQFPPDQLPLIPPNDQK